MTQASSMPRLGEGNDVTHTHESGHAFECHDTHF
eukprot:CAMPEP_0179407938 /NCGR_PEP_ID=MMETSP0799-20121207/1798_1 /TAXON_ID=46947 /ORGANISM="Geminigera cryophila, Strain CCMP2564" /LENGTH=33 /DNA_ID= /DNA_START= /DNA_END= /DNA_ORIENTATION=